MLKFWILHVTLQLCFIFSKGYEQEQKNLVVMTFNIWESGKNVHNGFQKIIIHIKSVNPDIVALQEVSSTITMNNLVRNMGTQWSGVALNASYSDSGILTRHTIVNGSVSQTSHSVGCQIKLEENGQIINFWSVHLDYKSYGPYAAMNKLVTDKDQIMAGEFGRFGNMRELLTDDTFRRSVQKVEKEPLIVCGDFNAPSHLDWTDVTRKINGGWTFDWPATKALQEETGLIDSYRELHPNVTSDPGITWSTVEKMTSQGWDWKIPEPQDRIDFVFYKASLLKAVASETYEGTKFVSPKPYHQNNDYPSDHYAVITRFKFI